MTTDIGILVQLALLLARLSLLSFGGGTTMLAEMEREMVGRGWITHQEFLESYAIGQVTPGSTMAVVVPMGYKAAGVPGAIVAFLAFFGPSVLVAVVAVALWSHIRKSRWPKAIRIAMLPVANGFMLASAYTVSTTTGVNFGVLAIAAATTAVILATELPAPAVMLGAGVLGAVFIRP